MYMSGSDVYDNVVVRNQTVSNMLYICAVCIYTCSYICMYQWCMQGCVQYVMLFRLHQMKPL